MKKINFDKLRDGEALEFQRDDTRIKCGPANSFVQGADWAAELYKQELAKHKKVVEMNYAVLKKARIEMKSTAWSEEEIFFLIEQAIESAKALLGE